MLLPPVRYADIEEMRGAEYCILSRGSRQGQDAVEIMWEDHSDSPYSLQLTAESFDMIPAEPPAGREWILTVWTYGPYKALEQVLDCWHAGGAKLKAAAKAKGIDYLGILRVNTLHGSPDPAACAELTDRAFCCC